MAKKKTDDMQLDIAGVDLGYDEGKNKKGESKIAKPVNTKTITTTMTTKAVETSVSANTRPASSVLNSQIAKGKTISEEVLIEDVAPAMGGQTLTTSKLKSKTISEEEVLRSLAYRRRDTKTNESLLYSIKKPGKNHSPNIEGAERHSPQYNEGLNKIQVQDRYDNFLANYVTKNNAKTYGNIFASNIFTFFNLLCLIAAAALLTVGAVSDLTFMVIILLNIGIGIFQEIRSKLTIEKLSLVTSPTAVVIRDGEKDVIPIDEVVLDDILYFESGKQICTDSIVVHGEIEANEALLTGESASVKKKIGDLLFAGSFVSSGACYARADRVGTANYIEGLTAEAKKYRKPKSELMTSLKKLINVISIFIVPIAALMLWTNYTKLGNDLKATITQTSGSVIGMIPAGMFLLTTVALAASVVRLAKRKALVQDLYCIEMLARADTLCLDKTGTITDGTMRVHKVIEMRSDLETGFGNIIGSMLTATEDNNQTAHALAAHFGYSTALKPKTIMPFSSARKFSAVTFESGQTFMLGAPEFVMKEYGPRVEKIVNEYAAQGFRVLLLATAQGEIKSEHISVVRRVAAIIVIEDHIRDDAVATIKWFKENDVAVKVISGDNPITVSEVAKRVGIDNADLYISLDGLSNQEVIEAANNYTVFGRVTPEQKALLIKSIKSHGHTVAMTGDGVNDILALKEADCSIAIASGSEAARNVSHLVLLNNNFNSMPTVVTEGRRVINNISKSSSLYLMKTIFSIMLSVIILFSSLLPKAFQLTYPFSPKHLLLLEFFVIGVPSLVLAMQENKNRIQGRFIYNLISNAVPGALTLVCAVMAVIVFLPHSSLAGEAFTHPDVATMLVWAFTGAGFIILFKLCMPFNIIRGVMYVGVIVGCVVAALGANSWYFFFTLPSFTNTLFLIVVVFASYGILSVFQAIAKELKKAGNKETVTRGNEPEEKANKHEVIKEETGQTNTRG